MTVDVDNDFLPHSFRRVVVNTKEDIDQFLELATLEFPNGFCVRDHQGEELFSATIVGKDFSVAGSHYDREILEHYCELALLRGPLTIEERVDVKESVVVNVIVFNGIPIMSYTEDKRIVKLASGETEETVIDNWNEVLTLASFSQLSSGLSYVLVKVICGDETEVYDVRTDPGMELPIPLKRKLLSRIFVIREMRIRCIGPLHGAYLATTLDTCDWDPDLLTCCL